MKTLFLLSILLIALPPSHAQQFKEQYELGKEAMVQKQYKQALSHYQVAKQQNDILNFQMCDLLLAMANSHVQLKDTSAAIANYKNILTKYDSYHKEAYKKGVKLETIFLKQIKKKDEQTEKLSKEKKYKEAIRLLDTCIILFPKEAIHSTYWLYNDRAIYKAELKDYIGAMKDYETAISLRPNYWAAYGNRGVLHKQIDNMQAAYADFEKALALNSQAYKIHYEMGVWKSNNGDHFGAIESFCTSLGIKIDYYPAFEAKAKVVKEIFGETKLDVGEKPLLVRKGDKYFNLEDYPSAIQYYTEAIEKDPTLAVAYLNRGLAEKENDNQKIKDYLKACQLDKKYCAHSYNNIGVVFNSNGNSRVARDYFQKAYQLDSNSLVKYKNLYTLPLKGSTYFFDKGVFYDEQDSLELALLYYDSSIMKYPSYTKAYNNRGNIYRQLGNTEAALADYDTLLAHYHRFPYTGISLESTYNNITLIYIESENYDMAIEYGKKLLQINSNNVNAHYFLAQANKYQGNYRTALTHYDHVHLLRPLNVKIFEERSDLKHFMDVLPLLQIFI